MSNPVPATGTMQVYGTYAHATLTNGTALVINPGGGAAGFVGSGRSGAGGWVNVTDAGSIGGAFAGTANNGDYVTAVPPAGTKAVYGIFRPNNGNAQAGSAAIMQYTVSTTVAGTPTPVGGVRQLLIDSYQMARLGYRYFEPLFRSGEQVWNGTTAIEVANYNVGQAASFQFEGFLFITNKAKAGSTPALTTLGDSWTARGGTSSPGGSYPNRLARMLSQAKSQQVALTNLGLNADLLFGQGSTRTGGMFRFVDTFLANPTSLFTLLYGPNDLGVFLVGGYMNALRSLLCLVADSVDLTTLTMAVGTPGWRTTAAFMPTVPIAEPLVANATTNYYGSVYDNYEQAVIAVRALPKEFTFLKVADIWDVMDGKSSLLWPNTSGPADPGNHPNDMGAEVIAAEFYRALVAA